MWDKAHHIHRAIRNSSRIRAALPTEANAAQRPYWAIAHL
jgi:hypothetical protein